MKIIKSKSLVILALIFVLSIGIVNAADAGDVSSDIAIDDGSDVLSVSIDESNIESASDDFDKVVTVIDIENITTTAGSNINIPINVSSADAIPFNDNVTVVFPDGTTQVVAIVNGAGSTSFAVPDDYSSDYDYYVMYFGNDVYASSSAAGVITVPPRVPSDIYVGNVNAKPGEKIYIPINVVPYYGLVFNGNVVVTLPDGSTRTVEIIDGVGGLTWTVPSSYNGTYEVTVTFAGNDTYEQANASGFIIVSLDDGQSSLNENQINDVDFDDKATGNPLFVLFMVLMLLGVNIKRKR